MKSEEIRGWTVVTVIGVLPVLFWRGVAESFDLIKATFLWFAAVVCGFTIIFDWARNKVRSGLRHSVLLLLLIASLITAVTSSFFEVSLYGQYARYVGFLTIFSYVLFAYVLSTLPRMWIERVRAAVVGSAFLSASYILIQHFGVDPFVWVTNSFGNPVFGTLGNPNTSSAYLALVAPVCITFTTDSNSFLKRSIGAVALVTSVLAVGYLNSFQGNIALVVSLVFAITRTIQYQQGRYQIALSLCAWVGLLLVSPSSFFDEMIRALIALVSITVILGGEWTSTTHRHKRPVALSTVAMISGGLSLLTLVGILIPSARRYISAGFSGGFLERGDFSRAAFPIFRDNPILGTGLDTFGLYFSAYRPSSHAISLEQSRTSSVHNVFLEMFSNGGLVLGLSFIVVCATPFVLRLRARKMGKGSGPFSDDMFYGLLATLVIYSVSVEHVVLSFMVFVYWGCLVGSGSNLGIKDKGKSSYRVTGLVASGLAAIALIMISIFAFRPFLAARNSQHASQSSSASERVEYLEKAARLMPSEPAYLLALGDQQLVLGLRDEASESLWKGIRASGFFGSVAPQVARVFGQLGEIERSLDIIEGAKKADPFAPQLGEDLEVLLQDIDGALSEAGITELDKRISELWKLLEQ